MRSDRIVSGLRRRFGISAPKLAVKTYWSWRLKASLLLLALLVLGGLFYGGYDAGRLFAGFNAGKFEEERNQLTAELTQLRAEHDQFRRENIELRHEAQIAQGARDELAKQITDLAQQNAALKEENVFFEKLLASQAGAKGSLAIQRLQAEQETPSSYHFRALVVQGGGSNGNFKGRLTLTATVLTPDGKRVVINLPEQQSELNQALSLDFASYQRVEGSFEVPEHAELKTLQVKVFAPGSNNPRAQQTLQL